MDRKSVFIIVGEGWDRDSIAEEIVAEGYDHDFYFGQSGKIIQMLEIMVTADEVWTFGDCSDNEIYKKAQRFKLDLWKMG